MVPFLGKPAGIGAKNRFLYLSRLSPDRLLKNLQADKPL